MIKWKNYKINYNNLILNFLINILINKKIYIKINSLYKQKIRKYGN